MIRHDIPMTTPQRPAPDTPAMTSKADIVAFLRANGANDYPAATASTPPDRQLPHRRIPPLRHEAPVPRSVSRSATSSPSAPTKSSTRATSCCNASSADQPPAYLREGHPHHMIILSYTLIAVLLSCSAGLILTVLLHKGNGGGLSGMFGERPRHDRGGIGQRRQAPHPHHHRPGHHLVLRHRGIRAAGSHPGLDFHGRPQPLPLFEAVLRAPPPARVLHRHPSQTLHALRRTGNDYGPATSGIGHQGRRVSNPWTTAPSWRAGYGTRRRPASRVDRVARSVAWRSWR